MTKRLNLLVVEDNEDDRAVYRRLLSPDDNGEFNISDCEDGEAALDYIENNPVDCALLDYSLPGRNGIEILKCIRAKHTSFPVVMLTGQENIAVAVTAIREGAQNYLSKSGLSGTILKQSIRTAIHLCEMENRITEQRDSLELFTRALAHDLKEPARTICSFVDIMERSDLHENKRAEYQRFVRDAAHRMMALIDSVYYIMRPNLREGGYPIGNAQQSVSAAIANLAKAIDDAQADVIFDPMPIVAGDTDQIARVFQNLISNALQYAGPMPKIRISVAQKESMWLFRVSDNGPGIEAKNLEEIFSPFKRLGDSCTGNLGLGLAICRKIIESYGGQIYCHSLPGKGTTFSFLLPCAPATSCLLEEAPAKALAPKQKTEGEIARVLIVDDNEADMVLNRYCLEDENKLKCDYTEARSGKEALVKLLPQDGVCNTDLVLLDINMPGMDGFEVLKKIKQTVALSNISVVICSTSDYDKDRATATKLGACGYLLKPIDFKELASIIDAVPNLYMAPEGDGVYMRRLARARGG
jgi:signal transduction histidine kinase